MKTLSNITLASDGTLVHPDVHDALLCGLFFSASRNVIILVRNEQGKILCFMLEKVERFEGEELREGNIILDITVETAVERDDVADMFGLREGNLDPAIVDRIIADKMSRFSLGELIFVRLNSSYGCSFACICHDVRFAENWLEEMEKSSH